MTRVVWTRPARDDLREIRAYIAQDSERYARVVTSAWSPQSAACASTRYRDAWSRNSRGRRSAK